MGAKGELPEKLALLLLLLLIVFHLASNIITLQNDTCHLTGDSRQFYTLTTQKMLEMRSMGLPSKLWAAYFETHPAWPPLFRSVSMFSMRLFGMSQDAASLANLPFLAILLAATYLVGRELFDRTTGLTSAILLSFFPSIFSMSRILRGDTALVATLTLSFYFLLKSKNLALRKESMLFALCLGLAALSKTTFSLFSIAPLLVLIVVPFVKNVRGGKSGDMKTTLLNILLGMLVVSAVALPWYVHDWEAYVAHRNNDLLWMQAEERPIGLEGFPSFLAQFNPFWLLKVQPFLPVSILFWAALTYFLFKNRSHRAFLLSWIAVPYVLLAAVGFGEFYDFPRFMIPILPAVAIILSYSLVESLRALLRRLSFSSMSHIAIIPLFLLLIEIPLFLAINFGSAPLPECWDPSSSLNEGIRLSDSLGILRPSRQCFNLDDVVDTLESEWADAEEPIRVFYLGNSEAVSSILWEHHLREQRGESEGRIQFEVVTCRQWHHAQLYNETWQYVLDYKQCLELYDSSNYAFLEPQAPISETGEEQYYYSNVLVPLVQHAEMEIAGQEVLAVLPLSVQPRKKAMDESFQWMDDSLWIIKRNSLE